MKQRERCEFCGTQLGAIHRAHSLGGALACWSCYRRETARKNGKVKA